MVQDVRLRVHDDAKRLFIAQEIGNEHFHAAERQLAANRLDRLGENRGAAVLQVVARDRRHDAMAQAHLFRRFRDGFRYR